MTNRKIGGTVYVRIDGVVVPVRGNVTGTPETQTRESVTGADGVHGYTETKVPAFIEVDITDRADVDWPSLVQSVGVEVQAETSPGRTLVLSNAWQINQGEVDMVEGQSTLRWESGEAAWRNS